MYKLAIILKLFILSYYSVHSVESDQNFVDNVNRLSLKLMNVLPQNENNFYSPLSITYSLYVLLNGAGGQTASELKSLLNIGTDATLQSINSDIKATVDLIRNKNGDKVMTRFGNRILVSKAYNLSENFKNSIEDELKSSVASVDFKENSPNITDEINGWIKEQTNDKIPQLFDSLDPDFVMVMANVLYFSANWEQQFFNYSTSNGLFYGSNGTVVNVKMMKQENDFKYRAVDRLNASLFELPFVEGSNASMVIVLPNEIHDLNKLMESLDSQTLCTELDALNNEQRRQLNITMPKFNLKSDYDLKIVLADMGLPSLFNENANLSLMTDAQNLMVSKAIHKAVLKVKESGVEAAAADGLDISECSWSPSISVLVDRPFLFLIKDTQTGLVMFMGQVYDPKEL